MPTHSRILLLLLLLLPLALAQPHTIVLPGVCFNFDPVLPTDGPGCGIPAFVNATEFGDNSRTNATLVLKLGRNRAVLDFTLDNLPKPDLVLTAWLVWLGGPGPTPDVFTFASAVSPCSSFRARYSAGMNREPNQFRYTSATQARLNASLNFDPTRPNQGALVANNPTLQSNVPSIQSSPLRQPPARGTRDAFIPITGHFLRRYDAATGFQRLDRRGRPVPVRSPVRARAVVVAAHIDRATHGLLPGLPGVDHYEIVSFALTGAIHG